MLSFGFYRDVNRMLWFLVLNIFDKFMNIFNCIFFVVKVGKILLYKLVRVGKLIGFILICIGYYREY